MIYSNISGYLEALEKYKNAPCRINNGVGKVLWDGVWMDFSDFTKENKVPIYEKPYKENPDGTRIN